MVLEQNTIIPQTAPLPFVRKYMLVDGTKYADTGCSLAPSCLNCPFEQCRYDVQKQPDRERMERASQIKEMVDSGFGIDYVAGHFEISRRTLFRALKMVKESL